MHTKKGQVGVEGMIAVGVVLFLFLGVYAIYAMKSSALLRSQQELNEHADCLKLANTITKVFTSGEDTEKTIKIYHNLTVQPNAQRIDSAHSFCTFSIKALAPTSFFILQPGDIKVENRNMSILINNI